MTDNEIYPEEQPQDTIDLLDDVEGHGLKEVAAGLGAAAVLAGGAAGATQLASSVSVHPSSGHGTTVAVDVGDPVQTVNDTTDRTIAAAQATRDSALDAVSSTAQTRVAKAETAVQNLPSGVDATVTSVHNTVHGTKAWATDVATSEVHRTTATADATVASTRTTAGSAVRDADRKLATVLNVVTTTAADGVHTATITLRAVDAGAGIDTSNAGGWVLVKAGDHVLAQVHLTNGGATASWTMPVGGEKSVQISYTGDTTFAPSARTMPIKPI